MRILMTGTNGFIGSHVAAIFRKRGDEIVHLGRRSAGVKEEVIWDFQSPLPEIPSCDVCLHLAAHIDFSKEFSVEQHNANTTATFQLAQQVMRSGKPFLFASTTGVQGWSGHISSSSPVTLQNPYAKSKYLAEEMVRSLDGRWTIFRIGGVYSLDGPAHLGLNRSISQAYHQRVAPTMKGPGTVKRNYIFVEDLARWIIALVDEQKRFDKATVYLASTETLSLREYVTNIADILVAKPAVFEEGADGQDMVVTPDKPPFALTTFSDYLQALRKQRDGG